MQIEITSALVNALDDDDGKLRQLFKAGSLKSAKIEDGMVKIMAEVEVDSTRSIYGCRYDIAPVEENRYASLNQSN